MSKFRIYPSKANTIASGKAFDTNNSSQNAVADLWFGGGGTDTAVGRRNSISRHLVKFDLTELQGKFQDFEINKSGVASYRLKFKNCIPSDVLLSPENEFDMLDKKIAASFDLIAFPINKDWDEGRGYDLTNSSYVAKQFGNVVLSGVSNWLSATTLTSWDEPGVFINPTASTPYYATQHFALGSEDIDMDVTQIVNDWLSGGSVNNGLAIGYSRPFELMSTDTRYISSFYTNKTNTAFKPYLEVNYNQIIDDDRLRVSNDRQCRLFLYLFNGNQPVNYFSAGTVTIKNSANVDVYTGLTPVQLSKGIYYVDVWMSGATKGQKYKDVWSGITINPGYDQQNIVQTFDIKESQYTAGGRETNDYVITTYGLANNESIKKGETVRLYVDTRINYSTSRPIFDYGLEFMMLMNGSTEVISWTPTHSVVMSGGYKDYVDVDTSWLLENQTYEILFRVCEVGTKRVIQERVRFKVAQSIGI
jgi:hypothetical protein